MGSLTRRAALVALALWCISCDEPAETTPPLPPRDPAVRAAVAEAKRSRWDERWGSLLPVGAMPAVVCEGMVFGLNLGLPLLFVLLLLGDGITQVGAYRRARRVEKGAQGDALAEAASTVVHGEVVAVEEGDAAAEIEVLQSGREHKSKNNHYVRWREFDRRIAVSPFVLKLAGGEVVRVVPERDHVVLVDDLGPPEVIEHGTRRRRARLELGEKVYVSGSLSRQVDPNRGLRGEVKAWVMRPPASGPMQLSTRPLTETSGRRAEQAFWWAIVWLLATAGTMHVLHRPYLMARYVNQQGTAVVVGTSKRQSDDDVYYLVTVRVVETGHRFDEALAQRHWAQMTPGTRLPVLYHPTDAHWGQLGQQASAYTGKLYETLFWLFGLGAMYLWRRLAARPWYARPVLEEKEDGGMPAAPA